MESTNRLFPLLLETRCAKIFCNFAGSLITAFFLSVCLLFLFFFPMMRLQGEAARQQAVRGGGSSESHRHHSGQRVCRQRQERGLRAQGMSRIVWWLLSDYPEDGGAGRGLGIIDRSAHFMRSLMAFP